MGIFFRWFLMMSAFGICLTGCDTFSGVHEEPPPPPLETKGDYKIRPFDLILLEMHMDDAVRRELRVSNDGYITPALIERVKAAGLTLHELQAQLTEKYRRDYRNPVLTLRIIEYAPRFVYVDGFVRNPGAVRFLPEEGMTLVKAITSVGGILPRGSRSGIKLTRMIDGELKTYTLDMGKINGGEKPDVPLAENDQIYVRDSVI